MSEAWSIAGEYMEACSCAFLCPCITRNATTPATEDFCKFAMTYRIDSGRFGATDLAGVTFAVVAQSKAVMSEGEWILGVIVDDRATEAQAKAIEEIASGRAGGPMAAFGPLVREFRGLERHSVRFEMRDGRRVATIPGVLELEIEGVPSAVAPGEYVAIDNTFHPANKRLNLATAVRYLVACFGIAWKDESNRLSSPSRPS
jgi:hypothetical protein